MGDVTINMEDVLREASRLTDKNFLSRHARALDVALMVYVCTYHHKMKGEIPHFFSDVGVKSLEEYFEAVNSGNARAVRSYQECEEHIVKIERQVKISDKLVPGFDNTGYDGWIY